MDLIGLSILFGIIGAGIIAKYEGKLHQRDTEIIDLKHSRDEIHNEYIENKKVFLERIEQLYDSIEEERQIEGNYYKEYKSMLEENLRLNRELNKAIRGINQNTLGG